MKIDEKRRPIVITLVGMSGSGKSRWSKKLAKRGFQRICCDDLIEKDLSLELEKYGAKGIQDVAHWMGQPYKKYFKRNQALYLNSEIRNMRKIVDQLKGGFRKDVVIDTTGSVVYTGDPTMKALKKYSLVIYMETPMSSLPEMLRIFMKKPKPIVWKNMFRKKDNETNEDALKRCYPRLLRQRIELYEKYADATLKYKSRTHSNFSVDDFIRFAENADMRKKFKKPDSP
jgi:shikimate kinase